MLAGNESNVRAGATGAFVALVAIAGSWLMQAYSRRWRVAELSQIVASAKGAALATIALTASLALARTPMWLVLGLGCGAVAFLLTIFARTTWRLATEQQTQAASVSTLAIVYGAGDGGQQIIEALNAKPESSAIRAVALLDDDPNLHGREIAGLLVVGGRDHLADVAAETGATEMIIAIPSANRELVRFLEAQATRLGMHTSVLPSVAELVGRAINPSDIRSITPADLLGRRPVDLDLDRRGSYLAGRTVLVTGAGGSIGSELCRQIHKLNPMALLMLDRDESALHALQLTIDGRGQLDTDRLIVADIRDADRVDDLFAKWKPDVIFHAAALKHLSLLEMHPHEGLKTNVLGSQHLLSAAARHGAARFVNVSTDKAADPTSVLGWTKHLAERLTTRAGIDARRPYLSVRFGNVLGSRGSVLTAFTKQIEDGSPITVTHPDVTRYFMTVEEAAGLVIAAGDIGTTGDVMILEMGEPVKILDMANELIDRSGAMTDIEFTGLRPGEKMHEVLQSHKEAIVQTDDGLMWRGASEPLDWNDVGPLFDIADPGQMVEALARLAGTEDRGTDDILLQPPLVGDAERVAVLGAIDSGWIAPAGPDLRGFEADLAERVGAEAVLAVSSGTAALHLALLAVGVGKGDEVVVQTSTFAASAFAVCNIGAVPVFGDIDAATGMLDPDALGEFLALRARSGRLPKAVMPVDLYGVCADYRRIRAACEPYGVAVVQDSAEALGVVSQGTPAGLHGDIGVFSFNGNKIITTSSGGALVGTKAQIERAAFLSAQAKAPVLHYEHHEIGFNFRMSNILAALGRAQLQSLDQRIERKLEVRNNYRSLLPDLEWLPDGVTEKPNYWLNVALLPEGIDPSGVVVDLQSKGIEARPSWKPMHLQPVFAESDFYGGGTAERFFDRGLCLPSGSDLSIADIERVADALALAIDTAPRSIKVAR